MKIISLKHIGGSSDFGFCIVNDDMASIHFARLKTANSRGLFDLAMFSPDTPGDLLDYVKDETARDEAQDYNVARAEILPDGQ